MGAIFSRCVSVSVPVTDTTRGHKAAAGNSATLQQPFHSPTDWLLSNEELTKSRGGFPRSDLAVYSTDANVTTFSSSDEYFKTLLRDLEAADVATVWITGWALNHTLPLDPTAKKHQETTLKAIVEHAVTQRGVHVRALVWANLFERKECLATRDWMNAIQTASGSALMLVDNRLPHHVSSHHQKSVVIKRKSGEYVAFVGGIDISKDRWDTAAHDQKSLRISSGWKDSSDGWIDAAVRLEGAAARDVAANFAARWNSSVKSANCWKEELLDFENPEKYSPIEPPPAPASASTASTKARTFVQIVRTFSPLGAGKHYPEIAPSGELSILESRLKAISHAKNFVYIEDQYFFFMPQLMETLRKVLTAQPALRVVVVAQRPTVTTQSKYAGYEKLLFEMASPLLHAFSSRFHIFTTKTDHNLYIHTKLVIVDDMVLSISSANWNRRSMTSDTELGASIVDTELVASADVDASGNAIQVGKSVREFRLRKAMEMTGRSVDTLRGMTISQWCEALVASENDPAAVLAALEVEDKWEFAVFNEEFTLHVVDPDDLNHAQHNGDSSDEE